jgi:hypothetical protein
VLALRGHVAGGMTENPWTRLDVTHDGPYVLDADLPYVTAFNDALAARVTGRSARSPHHIEETLVPEPWLGRRDAPVCMLLLNPGVGDDDHLVHADAVFRTRVAGALATDDSPHFHLADPTLSAGRRWWSHALASVRRDLKIRDASALSDAVSAIQLFPYHSREFAHLGVRVPSQAATIARVREHLERGTILLVRSSLSWVGVVPELAQRAHADHVFPLEGRRVHLNRSALGADAAYRTVLNALSTRVRSA